MTDQNLFVGLDQSAQNDGADINAPLLDDVPDVPTRISRLRTRINASLKASESKLRSCGTEKDLDLADIDRRTGYWSTRSGIANKPYRFILHLKRTEGGVVAHMPEANRIKRIGYINSKGDCRVVLLRVVVALPVDSGEYHIPGWEWQLVLVFESPLPAGSSGEVIDDFDPLRLTSSFQGEPVKLIFAALAKCPRDESTSLEGGTVTYDEATEAIRGYLSASEQETKTDEGITI